MKKLMKIVRNEDGQVLVLFALLMVVLMGFAALVIDVGRVVIEKQQLQNAIDTAALAAVQDLPDTTKAIATANQYIQLNGYEPADISITFSDSNKRIDISGAKEVSYTFAKVLGFTSTTVHPSTAAIKTWDPIFDFALFSDQDLENSGGGGIKITVTGIAHANGKVNYTSLNAYSKFDAVEAVGSVTVLPSSVAVGSKTSGVVNVTMPDYSELLKTTAKYSYTGDKTFSGNLDVNGSIYVNGNVILNNPTITGVGTIYATGTIKLINPISTGSNQVCIYSDSTSASAIWADGSKLVLNGILYAPKGGINIAANPITITGKVIGKTRVHFEADFSIIGAGVGAASTPSCRGKLVK